jgi:hypothetical protein
MKRIATVAFLAVVLFVFPSEGQAPDPREQQEQQLLNLIKEVQAQQTQITDNQVKIDEKLADVSELIRTARIFAGKVGK